MLPALGLIPLLLAAAVPDKLVVLTFDDAVKSHRTVVAPLLREMGFGATFFITHRWMEDREDFLTWEEVGEIHRMGFEIGNHSWTHANFSTPRNAAWLAAELALVERELGAVGVPRPVSFAFSGNGFGPEAVEELGRLGYRLARRGMQPEIPYGKITAGPAFDPSRHHSLLIPTTGDAYPGWTLEHFERVAAQARDGRVAVLQFHGVPDRKHPWVHTEPELFRRSMEYLKRHGYRAIALRDLEAYLPAERPADPMVARRHPVPEGGRLALPVEMEATQADLDYWVANMGAHGYTSPEMRQVTGMAALRGTPPSPGPSRPQAGGVKILPYPGGRHPRIGFLEGAVLPQRGTKASVFLPWDPASYVVVDLPEAIFSNLGLLWLAHTHIPTIWDARNTWLDNIDWTRGEGGMLSFRRELPNGVGFGASIRAAGGEVAMELWLHNGTPQPLSKLRAQVCVMLKGAAEFHRQTNANKVLRAPVAEVRGDDGRRGILTEWEPCDRVWGNPQVPCLHSDPVFPDCPPGGTVRARGRLWFPEHR